MLMMRPGRRGAARYRGCRTANIRHFNFGDASFFLLAFFIVMHHFFIGLFYSDASFLYWPFYSDASCRVVWTYGGLVTKIGSGDGCLCQQMWKKRNRCCLSKKRNPLTWKKRHKSGHKVATFSHIFVFYFPLQYPASDVESYISRA